MKEIIIKVTEIEKTYILDALELLSLKIKLQTSVTSQGANFIKNESILIEDLLDKIATKS